MLGKGATKTVYPPQRSCHRSCYSITILNLKQLKMEHGFESVCLRFCDMSSLTKGFFRYKAFDELNGTEVAWNQAKICNVLQSPDVLQRMYSEVHLLSALHHESLIRFHASWIDVENRTLNFITEMFSSGTLREYVRLPDLDVTHRTSLFSESLNHSVVSRTSD